MPGLPLLKMNVLGLKLHVTQPIQIIMSIQRVCLSVCVCVNADVSICLSIRVCMRGFSVYTAHMFAWWHLFVCGCFAQICQTCVACVCGCHTEGRTSWNETLCIKRVRSRCTPRFGYPSVNPLNVSELLYRCENKPQHARTVIFKPMCQTNVQCFTSNYLVRFKALHVFREQTKGGVCVRVCVRYSRSLARPLWYPPKFCRRKWWMSANPTAGYTRACAHTKAAKCLSVGNAHMQARVSQVALKWALI